MTLLSGEAMQMATDSWENGVIWTCMFQDSDMYLVTSEGKEISEHLLQLHQGERRVSDYALELIDSGADGNFIDLTPAQNSKKKKRTSISLNLTILPVHKLLMKLSL